MNETSWAVDDEEWIIWNGEHGLATTVTIGEVEIGVNGKSAWLDEPFDMVGPFSLDELEKNGSIAFEACLVMSRQRWKDDEVALRRESITLRRAAQQRMNEEFARYTERRQGTTQNNRIRKPFNEQQHRETLKLPMEGKLESRQIKAAFRRLAQKVHPDVGGSHEQFVRITEAKNALLEYIT